MLLPEQIATRLVRAAIYTRVSTDESLGMAFNSLDAQREACAAYIASQRHEGWSQLDTRYDDGGFSGGSMKRPALERLLADVRAGLIDTVVIYKVDRLTRSLSDFARIIEVLDAHRGSFVSVTQSFSTTSSMGRLTLNILLSFAQFEREVGAERVRDKIAASKKKGMWMGGVVPLGYDVHDRQLVVNEAEAETVREIFALYLMLGSVGQMQQALIDRGIVSKRRTNRNGKESGGQAFTRGALYNLISNVTYVGDVAHKGTSHPGQHVAILDRETFIAAQALLARNRSDRKHGTNCAMPSLLTGLLFDESGQRMSPSHASKGPRRYRYYFAPTHQGSARRQFRVPAQAIEQVVCERVARFLTDEHAVASAASAFAEDAVSLEAVLFAAKNTATQLASAEPSRRRELVLAIVRRIEVAGEDVSIEVNSVALIDLAGLYGSAVNTSIMLAARCVLVRRSREVRLAIAPGTGECARCDPGLVKLLVKAHGARVALLAGEGASLADVAAAQGHDAAYFAVLVKLAYLAPDLVEDILDGSQPRSLDRQILARSRALPMEWGAQARVLGFDL